MTEMFRSFHLTDLRRLIVFALLILSSSLIAIRSIANRTEPQPSVSRPDEIDWNKRFSFVPYGVVNCSQLLGAEINISVSFQNAFRRFSRYVTGITNRIASPLEGYTAKYPEAFKAYLHLASHQSVKTICETGFNAGHSTFGWLEINRRARVYSFDIGRHAYSRPLANYLRSRYPDRLHVTWGDSTETLPEFRRRHPDVYCDLMVVDGGHSSRVCKADLVNFQQLASKDNVVVLDNYPQRRSNYSQKLGAAWEWAKRVGVVSEMFHCRVERKATDFGFSVGRYIMNSC